MLVDTCIWKKKIDCIYKYIYHSSLFVSLTFGVCGCFHFKMTTPGRHTARRYDCLSLSRTKTGVLELAGMKLLELSCFVSR